MSKLMSVDSGNLGEYEVLAELTRRNYVAVLTGRNTKDFDIIACNKKGTKFAVIQVKSIQSHDLTKFRLTEKHEQYSEDQQHFYYVFVSLANDKFNKARFYVVPAKDVAEFAREAYQKYINTKGPRVAQRKESSMRWFEVDENKYKESDFSILDLED